MVGLGFLWSIIIGLLAGAIAGWIMKGKGSGFFLNLFLGLIGSVIGGWVYGLLGISATGGKWGVLVMSTVGAVVLLFVVSLLRGKSK